MTQSILDNDQYKFTMQQALLKLGYAATPVEYRFKCRNEGINFLEEYPRIKCGIDKLQNLQFHSDEIDYLRSLRFFTSEYIEFLKYFRFDIDLVHFNLNEKTNELEGTIKGSWFHTILFEVPLLEIISSSFSFNKGNISDARNRLREKLINLPEGFRFADFGTRRRRDSTWHNEVIEYCKTNAPNNFVGTSNLFMAMKHNLKSIGTMAHEWLQAHQQLGFHRLVDSQRKALENWVRVYRGDLGIALSDVINTDAFLKDFSDPFLYKLFDGVREDSEPDPKRFGHRIVNFYLMNRIDPKTKTIVFSNGLTFEKAINIYNELHNLIGLSFGIGTNLTNDWSTPALNIVIKMIKCNGQPVAKISNSPGKGMCESSEFVSYLKSVYNLEHN